MSQDLWISYIRKPTLFHEMTIRGFSTHRLAAAGPFSTVVKFDRNESATEKHNLYTLTTFPIDEHFCGARTVWPSEVVFALAWQGCSLHQAADMNRRRESRRKQSSASTTVSCRSWQIIPWHHYENLNTYCPHQKDASTSFHLPTIQHCAYSYTFGSGKNQLSLQLHLLAPHTMIWTLDSHLVCAVRGKVWCWWCCSNSR